MTISELVLELSEGLAKGSIVDGEVDELRVYEGQIDIIGPWRDENAEPTQTRNTVVVDGG